jgi:L-ascorbate metabolism protein UlaG (beta-lactamase superfamily)
MSELTLTHIGGPTVLLEFEGWRVLTDPTFDPPGRRYSFGWGSSSRKLIGPAIAADQLGQIDAVLLSHDHHADNLDDAGRALLTRVPEVVTTASGARRLGAGCRAVGLTAWQSTTLERHGRPAIEVTATPCRHGPPGSHPIVGDVIGFALAWEGQRHGRLWISGDTVLYADVRTVPERLEVGTAVVHLGEVRFPITGPLRYTMNARQAVDLLVGAGAHTIVPVHYDGWSHFRQPVDDARRALAAAVEPVRSSVRWAAPGEPLVIAA